MKLRTLKKTKATKQIKAPSRSGPVKKVKVTFYPSDYTKALAEVEKYPLSLRLAAELHRAGITPKEFADKYHAEDSIVSRHVEEELRKLAKGITFDPDRVPAFRPVYVAVSDKLPEKPVTHEDRLKLVQKFVADLEKAKWSRPEILRAFREATRDEDKEPVKKFKQFDDSDEPVSTKKAAPVYRVEYPSGTASNCRICEYPLRGTAIRNETEEKGKPVWEDYHLGCWIRHKIPPAEVADGTVAFDPVVGCDLYFSKAKSIWVTKEEYEEIVAATSRRGVSGASREGEVSAATVPVAAGAGA